METINYKEKAEQYVREQLPDLMELSSGCEVRWTYSHALNRVARTPITKRGKVIHQYKVAGTMNDVLDVLFYGNRTTTRITHGVDDVEIIGHPIRLNDWLRVLETHSDDHMVIGNYGKDKGFFVSFGDDFEEGDVWHRVNFNLTTGQPATEEDWKAFCEIVGI